MKKNLINFLCLSWISIPSLMAATCYPYRDYQLCVPLIGETEEIVLTNNQYDLFPSVLYKLFNQSANFSGPNCYNAALVISGILAENEIRYVSPLEFESLLSANFDQVETPSLGDIVVYEANSGRGHSAYYLGEDLVFHKKSYHKNFLYRILPLEQVGYTEPNEWQPGPFDNLPGGFPSDIGKTKKAYYRKKNDPAKFHFSKTETLWISVLEHIQNELIKAGPNWAVGKRMGLISELTLSKLNHMAQDLKLHPHILARLTSLEDQIFQSLEENYFARARSQRQIEEINEEICFQNNDYTSILTQKLTSLLKLSISDVDLKVLKALKSIDRKKCEVNLVDIISSLPIN